MRNIKVLMEYDGTDFCGWQTQAHSRSVQEELEKAITQITGETVRTTGAGRTDTGVHARGQVANFTIEKKTPLDRLLIGLNAVLPKDVRIKEIAEAPETFSARFSAKERRYKYYISKVPIAAGRQYCLHFPHPLSVPEMQKACALLLGEKSFKSFCLSEAQVLHYRCEVRHASWIENNSLLIFEIHANRFLHNMVRAIVGTMIQLGQNKITFADFERIIQSEDRRLAGYTASAAGLFLEEVVY